jgi:hypothetical protein
VLAPLSARQERRRSFDELGQGIRRPLCGDSAVLRSSLPQTPSNLRTRATACLTNALRRVPNPSTFTPNSTSSWRPRRL